MTDNDAIDLYGWYLEYQTTPEFAAELAALPLPRPDWFFMLDFFDRRCAICRRLVILQPTHWLPEASQRLEADIRANTVPMCADCIAERGDMLPFAWLRSRFGGVARAQPTISRIDAYRTAVYNK